MGKSTKGRIAEYEGLRDRGTELIDRGQLAQALELFREAHALAEQLDDPTVRDLAFCNRAALELTLRHTGDWVPRLQEMVLRTADTRVARFAAYNLALAYEWERNFKKSLFYSRIAHRYSAELADPGLEASALNLIGNALVALNDAAGAGREFDRALALLPERSSVRRAVILGNAGYAHLLRDELPAGFRDLFSALRTFRHAGARYLEIEPRLSLSFAYLQRDRPSRALHHANVALDLAEEFDNPGAVKSALLLIGEAYKRAGDTRAARRCFDLLQETFYPDMTDVPAMLLGLDVCKVINLRA